MQVPAWQVSPSEQRLRSSHGVLFATFALPSQSPVEGLHVPALRQASPGHVMIAALRRIPSPCNGPSSCTRSHRRMPPSPGFVTTCGVEHTPFVHVPAA